MSKSQIRLGIILLTVTTALIHLVLSFRFPTGPDPIFMLNGLGYLGLVALLYLPTPLLVEQRHFVRWLLLGYTALTVLLWLFMGVRSMIAYIDKLIELALIGLLWLEVQRRSLSK